MFSELHAMLEFIGNQPSEFQIQNSKANYLQSLQPFKSNLDILCNRLMERCTIVQCSSFSTTWSNNLNGGKD